jgi:hypothetical protein
MAATSTHRCPPLQTTAVRIDVYPEIEMDTLKSEAQEDSLLLSRSHSTSKQPTIDALPTPQPVIYYAPRVEFELVDNTRNLFITPEQEEILQNA